MNVCFETIPEHKIAYIRHNGPYGTDNIKTMKRLKNWARTHELLNEESVILGIALDDPSVTSPEQCRYDTCILVPNDYDLMDDTVQLRLLEGGTHAIFTIEHTAKGVATAWRELFPSLAANNLHFDPSRPILERYQVKLVKAGKCELCVPIL